MKKKVGHLSVRDITTIGLLATVLFVQEEALTFLPNIQLTVLLIVLYSECLGFWKTTIIVIIHVLLDNLVMASFNPIYTPFMFVGWELIPILLCTVFKRVSKPLPLAFLGILFSFLYSWVYMIPNTFFYDIPFVPYLVSDIPFECLLASSSFLSILWLYSPLKKVLDKLQPKNVERFR
jgi:energy-coupling factor transport system substrate-specific component